jgi:hypothetical protein
MLWLLSALGWAKSALTAILSAFTRYPLHCALIASLALSAALWTRGNRYRDKAAECAAGRVADRRAYTAAQAEAKRLAIAAREAKEAEYRAKAKESDNAKTTYTATVSRDADRFIAAHRMRRQAAGSPAGSAGASPEGASPGVPFAVPGFTLVADADVRACSELGAYATAAHEWSLSLGE